MEWQNDSGTLGDSLVVSDGTKYTYNREDVYNREGYIIANRLDNIKVRA